MKRQDFLRTCARSGVLMGIAGVAAVLVTREEKFECSNRCGKCPKLEKGKCGLGLK
jgi:hypothetical protein